jgi:lysophospholipase L1-like esterase
LHHCAIERAELGETGISGDWLDEIHLTAQGHGKLASAWTVQIEKILRQNACTKE